MPVAGIFAGMGVNFWIVQQVSDAAYWTYRERFIREKMNEPNISMPDDPSDRSGPDDAPIEVWSFVEDALRTDEAVHGEAE